MAQQGVNIWTQLPIKNSLLSANDRIVVLFGVDTANTTNSVAQTATISTTNLLQWVFSNAPNTNPHVNGALWVNNGVVMVSNG